MKRLLLVSDPVGGPISVQFQLVSSFVARLRKDYQMVFYTPYCDRDRRERLTHLGCDVKVPRRNHFVVDRLLRAAGVDSESMLWAESWVREAFLGKNTAEAEETLGKERFDYVVNLSMTVPVKSDLWWILGTPLDQTLRGMAGTNLVAFLGAWVGDGLLPRLDQRVMSRIQSQSHNIVANSPYLHDLYRERGTPVEGVVYTLTEMSEFAPTNDAPKRDYVLLYLGKETETIDFEALKRAGLRIVAFGSKIPAGSHWTNLKKQLEFRGRVSRDVLVALYSNALFTLFPFTCEPMGLVPIESMACGTPVLTYNRQGPASTVLNGVTGWLVDSREQLVTKAIELWHRGTTGILPETCIRRAQEFTVSRSVDELRTWIEGRGRLVLPPMQTSPSRPFRSVAPLMAQK